MSGGPNGLSLCPTPFEGTMFVTEDFKAISGNNDAEFFGLDENQCKEKCAIHTDFDCKSIDYLVRVDPISCRLSKVKKGDAGIDFIDYPDGTYFEKIETHFFDVTTDTTRIMITDTD